MKTITSPRYVRRKKAQGMHHLTITQILRSLAGLAPPFHLSEPSSVYFISYVHSSSISGLCPFNKGSFFLTLTHPSKIHIVSYKNSVFILQMHFRKKKSHYFFPSTCYKCTLFDPSCNSFTWH